MAMPKMAIYLLLVTTIGMALFSAVSALRCYVNPRDEQIDEFICPQDNDQGCGTAQCGSRKFYGCASRPDYQKLLWHSFGTVWMHESCEKSYCTDDLCNNKGLEKTGFKCNRKELYENEITVQECVSGHVGCDVGWYCGENNPFYSLGCSSVDECKSDGDTGRCCVFCDTELCNNESLKPKIAEKSTTPKNEESSTSPKSDEESTPKNEEEPTTHESDEMSSPKSDENPDPPNGSAGIVGWGQLVIIPIGMMTLVLGAGLLKMLTI